MSALARLGDALWNPWLLVLFLLVGGYYSLRTGFFQVFGIRSWWRATVGALLRGEGGGPRRGLSQLQAISTALAATIGTGSIAGVATAVFFGGPGAVFWMWVSALLGMMTSCAEKTLAVRFRRPAPGGGWRGGPMCYIRRGLGMRGMAAAFSLLCAAQTLTGGSLIQANSIASSLHAAFGAPPLAVGLVTAALTGAVVLGGVGRIGRVSELLVPAMALLFVGGGLVVLAVRARAIPGALRDILLCAFQPRAAAGGYCMATALRFGVARGVFTNEAGLGTSAIAHAAADVDHPARQGMWGIFEVFASTLVVCTVTALVILTSGVYSVESAQAVLRAGAVPPQLLGAPLTAAAFAAVLGPAGRVLVSLCLLLFAFTSLLGSSYYGQRGVEGLTRRPWAAKCFQAVYLGAVVLGALVDVGAAWQLADVLNALLALPNLAALLLLSPVALPLIREFLAPAPAAASSSPARGCSRPFRRRRRSPGGRG